MAVRKCQLCTVAVATRQIKGSAATAYVCGGCAQRMDRFTRFAKAQPRRVREARYAWMTT